MPSKSDTLLKEYQAKRDFTKTQEPSGKAASSFTTGAIGPAATP